MIGDKYVVGRPTAKDCILALQVGTLMHAASSHIAKGIDISESVLE